MSDTESSRCEIDPDKLKWSDGKSGLILKPAENGVWCERLDGVTEKGGRGGNPLLPMSDTESSRCEIGPDKLAYWDGKSGLKLKPAENESDDGGCDGGGVPL